METIVIAITLILFGILLFRLLEKFGVKNKTYFLAPIIVFGLGFWLRLSEKAEFIDIGYWLTDFCGFFMTVLFVACLYLGQVKYWKKKV